MGGSSVVGARESQYHALQNHAVVVHAAGDVRFEPADQPQPAPGEAVVAIAYGGICGSDVHYWRDGAAGTSILRTPMVLGHEVSGVVHRAAADGSGPAEGTAVTVHPGTPHAVPGVRYPADRPQLAPGGTYLGSAARMPHTDGAFMDRVALPAHMLRPVDRSVPLRVAALAEPAAVAWHGVRRAGAVRGSRAMVVGAGPIRALTVAVLRHLGAAEVLASDVHEFPRTIATRLGAHETIDALDAEATAAVQADVVYECSGTSAGLQSALAAAGRGGTVVMVGLQRAGDVAVAMASVINKELALLGSFRFAEEITDVLDAMAGGLDLEAVITHELPAREVSEALELTLTPTASKVLLRFSD